MRISPITSLFTAPIKATTAVAKAVPDEAPRDQASISSSPAPVQTAAKSRRWLDVARGLTLGIALVGGVMGSIGVGSYLCSQHGGATDRLLSADKNLSSHQRQLANAELMPMGDHTLRWLGASGERIYITENDGQVVSMYQQMGKLNPLEPGSILAQGLKMQSALEHVSQQPDWRVLQEQRDSLNLQADQLRQQWLGQSKPLIGGLGMMATNSPPPPALMDISKQQLKVHLEMDQLRNQAIQKAGADTQLVRPGMGSIESLLVAARAKTPEQRQEFVQLLKAVNGGAIEKQQAEALQVQRKILQNMPAGPIRDQSEKAMLDPDKVFLGMESPILIPQFTYFQIEDQSVRLKNDDPIIGKVDALGLHFNGRGVVQVDADQVGGKTHVINHELGHSMDDLLRQQNPEFHGKWSAQVKEALAEARQRHEAGKPVASNYSLTNEAEYVAEGVEYYYENPDMLKTNDPKLFALTEQLLHQADEQGKLNLKESLAMLAAAGLLGLAFGLTGPRRQSVGA